MTPGKRVPGDSEDQLSRWVSTDGPHGFESLYDELRELARRRLSRERAGHTLQPTALVNEVFVKLASSDPPPGTHGDRNRFLAFAARAMRQILIDHARRNQAQKRGQGQGRRTIHAKLLASPNAEFDALELQEALEQLARIDSRMAQVVELRFFGEMRVNEIAEFLQVSDRTIERDWMVARAWLLRRLSTGEDS